MVYANILKLCNNPQNTRSLNLSSAERIALEELEKDGNIIIRTADKGGRVVIQGREDYIKEVCRLLFDSSTHQKLPGDPILRFKNELHVMVEEAYKLVVIYILSWLNLSVYYLQKSGTGMGANFAPCYANLFMDFWEKYYIWSGKPFRNHMIFYGRYMILSSFGTVLQIQSISWSSTVSKTRITSSLHM